MCVVVVGCLFCSKLLLFNNGIFYFPVKYKILYRRACLITIQKNVRMFLAKRIHQPRYKGIMKINSLQVQYSSNLFILPIDVATKKFTLLFSLPNNVVIGSEETACNPKVRKCSQRATTGISCGISETTSYLHTNMFGFCHSFSVSYQHTHC